MPPFPRMRAHPPPLSHPRTATRTPANCLPGTSHKAVERCSRWRESTAVLAVDPPRRLTVAQLFLYLDAHSMKAPAPPATLAWDNWSPLVFSRPGSVPAVVVRPTFSPISRWLRVIAAGCSFCSQGRFSLNLGAVRAGLKSNFSRKYLRRRGRLHHNVRERTNFSRGAKQSVRGATT